MRNSRERLANIQPDYLHNHISVQSTGRTRSDLISCHPSWTTCIFLIRPANHQPLFHICITSPVESAPFFIPSTSLCSHSSRFTSSQSPPSLSSYHSLDLSLPTENSSLSQILSSIVTLFPSGLPSRILTCTELGALLCLF